MNGLNTIALLIAVGLAVFIQSTWDGFRFWLGAPVDFLPILMLYAALATDLVSVSILALVGGLLFDSLSANPLGASVLPLAIVGLAAYLSRASLLRDQVVAQVLLGGAAGVLTQLLAVLFLLLLVPLSNGGGEVAGGWESLPLLELGRGPTGWIGPRLLVGWPSVGPILTAAAAGALLTPLIFRAFDWLNRTLSYPVVSAPTFRADREIKRGRSI